MPRRVLTPEQIAAIPGRIAAGERAADVGADLGVSRSAVDHHGADRLRRRILGSPWAAHTRAAKRALRHADYATAAAELRVAADLIAARA